MTILRYFLNPIMLFAALLALVPLILHLLHRSRYQIETWGAMMFLQESLRIRGRAVRIQQIILLVMRASFFVLLALALARPVMSPATGTKAAGTPGEGEQQNPPTTHVLILDSSYSLQQGGHDANFFDRVRDSALRILDRMPTNDNMLLVLAGQKPRTIIRKPSADSDFLRSKIMNLEPGYEKADLVLACQQAFRMLESSTKPKHRIYILIDRQAASWHGPSNPRWQELDRHYRLLKIKPAIYVFTHQPVSPPSNTLIRNIYTASPIIDVFRLNRFQVEIENFGDPRKVRVDFFAGKKQVGEREVVLQPGVNSVEFDYSFKQPGSTYVSARIPHDEIVVDNTYTKAVQVVKQVPVLIIEGQGAEDPFNADAGVVRAALTAASDPGDDVLFVPTVRNQADIDKMDSAYLARFKSILLVNVASLSSLFRARLERFVNQGGGLLIGLGKDISIENYNSMYSGSEGMLPAAITTITDRQEIPVRPSFPAGDPGTVLTTFDLQRTRVLNDVRVHQYVRVLPAEGARVLARFENHPFLILKRFGKGNVVLWTTSMNADWTNFPVTRDYLPLVQDLVVFLSGTVQPPINLQLGEMLLYAADVRDSARAHTGARNKALIHLPDGSERVLPLSYDDGQWLGQFTETRQAGLYRVTCPGRDDRFYAVHLDPDEGNLATLTTKQRGEIARQLHASFVTSHKQLAIRMEREQSAREWWQPIILVAVLLLMFELFLGWKFTQ